MSDPPADTPSPPPATEPSGDRGGTPPQPPTAVGDESVDPPFSPGQLVRVIAGTFRGLTGSIAGVDETAQKLVVVLSMFGSTPPIELEFAQVELIDTDVSGSDVNALELSLMRRLAEDPRHRLEMASLDLLGQVEFLRKTVVAVLSRRREAGDFGAFDALLDDPLVTKLVVNHYDDVRVERSGRLEAAGASFHDEEHLFAFIQRIAHALGTRIDAKVPLMDVSLPGGGKVRAEVRPITRTGPSLVIVKGPDQITNPLTHLVEGLESGSPEVLLAPKKEVTTRVAVLVSGHGRGSNFQALVDACAREGFPARVAVLVSLNPEAGALARARACNIPAEVIDPKQFSTPEELDTEIVRRLRQYEVELVCLGGYLRRLSPVLLQAFPQRIMNIHPALLPAFGGKGMYGRRVHKAVLESGARVSGATVHFVDEEYDHGPIILQQTVPVEPGDTAETLAARVLAVEHEIYPRAVELFARGYLQVEGRNVRILE